MMGCEIEIKDEELHTLSKGEPIFIHIVLPDDTDNLRFIQSIDYKVNSIAELNSFIGKYFFVIPGQENTQRYELNLIKFNELFSGMRINGYDFLKMRFGK